MPDTTFLKPLDDMAYVLECQAVDYTGELKSELGTLCRKVRETAPGYEAPAVQASLADLEKALDCYQSDRRREGASLLSAVSRRWRKAVAP